MGVMQEIKKNIKGKVRRGLAALMAVLLTVTSFGNTGLAAEMLIDGLLPDWQWTDANEDIQYHIEAELDEETSQADLSLILKQEEDVQITSVELPGGRLIPADEMAVLLGGDEGDYQIDMKAVAGDSVDFFVNYEKGEEIRLQKEKLNGLQLWEAEDEDGGVWSTLALKSQILAGPDTETASGADAWETDAGETDAWETGVGETDAGETNAGKTTPEDAEKATPGDAGKATPGDAEERSEKQVKITFDLRSLVRKTGTITMLAAEIVPEQQENPADADKHESNTTKAFTAKITTKSENGGGKDVWIGYEFVLTHPNDANHVSTRLGFANTEVYKDLSDETRPAVSTKTTGTPVIETFRGKYHYVASDHEGKELGSSATSEFGIPINIKDIWGGDGDTYSLSMRAWIVPDDGSDPGTVPDQGVYDGGTVTAAIQAEPSYDAFLTFVRESLSGYYDEASGKIYPYEKAATDAGASAVPGRIYQASVEVKYYPQQALQPGNELIAPAGIDIELPLKITEGTGAAESDVTAAELQPKVIGLLTTASSSSSINGDGTTKNKVPGGPADLTWDGRVAIQNFRDDVELTYTSFENGTLKFHASRNRMDNGITGGTDWIQATILIFVPLDKDHADAKRNLKVGDVAISGGKSVGGKDIKDKNVANNSWRIEIKSFNELGGQFVGAYSRELWLANNNGSGAKNFSAGYKDAQIVVKATNHSTGEGTTVNDFDIFVKVDADVYQIKKEPVVLRKEYFGGGRYEYQYAVLAGGGNWSSDAAMNSARKDDTNIHYVDTIAAAGSDKIVGVLIKGRDGRMLNSYQQFRLDVDITADTSKAGGIYQVVYDVDIWRTGTPVTDPPTDLMHGDAYVKDSWDSYGNRVTDSTYGTGTHGACAALMAYEVQFESAYNLNGERSDNNQTSKFNIDANQRILTRQDTITVKYLGDTVPEGDIIRVRSQLVHMDKMKILPDSVRVDADYEPGARAGDPGLVSGGTLASVTTDAANKNDYITYDLPVKDKESIYTLTYQYVLGDDMDMNQDIPSGNHDISHTLTLQESSKNMAALLPSKRAWTRVVIWKTGKTGLEKKALDLAPAYGGKVGYRLRIYGTGRVVKDFLAMDIFPFVGDGRGTTFTGSFKVKDPLKLTVVGNPSATGTSLDIYYTTDEAVKDELGTSINDIYAYFYPPGGIPETVTAEGITWERAAESSGEYTVDEDTKAIILRGTAGLNQTPTLDVLLTPVGAAPDDQYMNTAKIVAPGEGGLTVPIETDPIGVEYAVRNLKGRAWVDSNKNGAWDSGESALPGLTVKLWQGTTQIKTDEAGGVYGTDGALTTDINGEYEFKSLPDSPEDFYVTFEDSAILEPFSITEYQKTGVPEDENSDVNQEEPNAAGRLIKATSSGINMPTREQQGLSGKLVIEKRLDAGFVKNTYQVVYDANGGSNPPADTNEYEFNDQVTVLDAGSMTYTGYKLDSWKVSGAAPTSYQPGDTFNIQADTLLEAQWTLEPYTITYNLDGGSADPATAPNPTEYNIESADITLNAPIKTGYDFAGWTGTGLTAATETVVIATGSIGNRTYTATWTPNQYKVHFEKNTVDSEGGSLVGTVSGEMADQTFTYDEISALTDNAYHIDGYTFAGWATRATAANASYTDGTDVKNLTDVLDGIVEIFAVWNRLLYLVSYDTAGGTPAVIPDMSGVYWNTSGLLPASNPTRTGYDFLGWKIKGLAAPVLSRRMSADYVETSDTYGDLVKAMGGSDLTMRIQLEAQWKAHEYDVVFEKNGPDVSGTMDSQRFAYGEAPKELTRNRFTRPGYTFAGWSTAPDGAVVYTDKALVQNLTEVLGDRITLYALWNKNGDTAYTVEHYLQGSDGTWSAANHTVQGGAETGSSVTAVPKNFAGYRYQADHPQAVSTGIVRGDGSLVLKLYYQKEVTVKFDAAGGSEVPSQTLLWGDKSVKPENPSRSGSRFEHWKLESNGVSEIWDFEKPITADMTLTAVWVKTSSTGGGNSGGGGGSTGGGGNSDSGPGVVPGKPATPGEIVPPLIDSDDEDEIRRLLEGELSEENRKRLSKKLEDIERRKAMNYLPKVGDTLLPIFAGTLGLSVIGLAVLLYQKKKEDETLG